MSIERTGEGSIVKLPAQFRQAASQSLSSSLGKENESGATRIVVDYKETAFIDSSAIGALVSITKEARALGISLCIRNLSGYIAAFAE